LISILPLRVNSPDRRCRRLSVHHGPGWLHMRVPRHGTGLRPTRMHLPFPSCQTTRLCKRSHNHPNHLYDTTRGYLSETTPRIQWCQTVINFPLLPWRVPLTLYFTQQFAGFFFASHNGRSSSVSLFRYLPSGGQKKVPSTTARRTTIDSIIDIKIRCNEPSPGLGQVGNCVPSAEHLQVYFFRGSLPFGRIED
jgi:hypothetical protein